MTACNYHITSPDRVFLLNQCLGCLSMLIRVVHSSHFQAIFRSFSVSFFFHFSKMKLQNESKMNRKMIIFEKSNPSLTFAKMVIFTFIFTSHFSRSFKLRSDTHQQRRPPTSIPHTHHLPSLLPRPLLHQLMQPTITNQPHWAQTTIEVVWALGNVFFSSSFLCFSN